MPTRLIAAFAALILLASPASAWSWYSHGVIAEIALESVRPETRREVRSLLAKAPLLETPDCVVAPLSRASSWADCVLRMERYRPTAPWHYQNIDVCKPFDATAACPDGKCVSAQVERQAALLADRSLPDGERLEALLFLIHFVGDLHQPLHSGDRGDRGGNSLPANYGLIGGRLDLHDIWDSQLAERAVSTPPAESAGLLSEVARPDRRALAAGSVADWSRDAWSASREFAYATALGDPCGSAPPTRRPVLTESQVQALIPVVRRQVVASGLRLGRLLDEALARPRP